MSRSFWLLAAMSVSLLCASLAKAQTMDLVPFLQGEVNEIATLTAQSNYLTQQGDALGAALVASYIPDHQMQASMLAAQITAQGGNPAAIVANETPFLGTRADIISHDIDAHKKVVEAYNNLQKDSTVANIDQLAMLGVNGASRHFASLQIAQAAITGTPDAWQLAIQDALFLERAAIANLQVQSSRLAALGDTAGANALLGFVPQHQNQANCLAMMLTQMGGDQTKAVPPPAVALATRDQIVAAQRTFDTQLINTYALPATILPTTNPLRQAFLNGQGIVLASLNWTQGYTRPS